VSSAPIAAPLSPGAVFHGRYRIVRALKSGAMGAVYEAVDENTAAPRALKVMLPSILGDADQRARFALEAKVTGSIESDHLVRVSDSGVDEASGSPFLVMELLRGEELGELLAKQGALPSADVVTYLAQASLALDKTHAAGIVHRDVKPDNLLVTKRDDGSPCVKILDFGIAKVVAQNQQKTRALGTPLYMAPEQIKGEGAIGPRADLYSLGQVAYTLLTGEPYWAEEAAADPSLYGLLTKVMAGAVDPPAARALRRRGVSLPPSFDAWFFKATAPSQEGRFDRATLQTAALAEVFAAPPPSAAPPTAPMSAVPSTLPATQPSAGPGLPADAAPVGEVLRTQAQPIAEPPLAALPFTAPPVAAPAAQAVAPAPATPAAATPAAVTPAPVPPRRSRRRWVVLLVAVLLLAAGAGGVWFVLFQGAGEDDASAGKPLTSCASGSTCFAMELSDPAHVDAQAILPAVVKIARNAEARALLTGITVNEPGKDGTVDLTGDKQIVYQFSHPYGGLSITVRKKTAAVTKTPPLPNARTTPEPLCSVKAAFKAAAAAGFAPAGTPSVTYGANELWPSVWTLTSGKQSTFVDGKACTVKTVGKAERQP
jgi:serine/threonine-protein kinase